MAKIPGGVFWMGSDGSGDEAPRHRVALRSFCMDRTEATVAAWRACVEAGACTPAHPGETLCNDGRVDRDDHPINCMDWEQATAFCKHAQKRLPSEREWEYAARGGADQRMYSWGWEPPDGRACYRHEGTCKVASYAQGAFGLYDINGNVWEWTSSFFGRYPDEPEKAEMRVYRGGSFSRRFPRWLANGLRNRFQPSGWGAHLGVRCAKSVEEPCPLGSTQNDAGDCVADPDPNLPFAKIAGAKASGALTGRLPESDAGAPAPNVVEPLSMARQPDVDADCEKYKPGHPKGWLIRGGEFSERQQKKASQGCVNRDVGVGFNSVCCAR